MKMILKKIGIGISLILFNYSMMAKDITLLNVSYDPTREFYVEYNKRFSDYWKNKTKDLVKINQSHGGSGKQARSVMDGLEADVVTLALGHDIDILATKGLVSNSWQKSFPHGSAPYTSTIVFVVRKGNPKNIKDWDDLGKDKISVITPNPKTSGGARWNYLAVWGFAAKKFKNDFSKTQEFVTKVYKNVPVLDSGARGSTTTFMQNGIGDVLLAWENEAYLLQNEIGKDKFEIIVPSMSILAEPPVALLEKNCIKHDTTEVAKEYLNYLYTEQIQELIAQKGFRPRNEKIAKKYLARFPKIELFNIEKDFGGWGKAHKDHFSDGGSFDKIYKR